MSKLVQTGFCSSCKQSNPQQNKKVDIQCFIIFGLNIYCLFGMIMETNLEYTQRYTYMCCRCCKNIILMNETGFYNIEEFYQSCNFCCFWQIFFYVKLTCCTHQNICLTGRTILGSLLYKYETFCKPPFPIKNQFVII